MADTSVQLELRHLSRIIESSDDAIVGKDLNGVVRIWNRAAERIFGYSAQEAIGQSIRMIIPEDRYAEEDDVMARIRDGEEVQHFETVRKRKDGSRVPISLSVSPIRDDHGVVVGAAKIARDISDRKLADFSARRLAAVVESSDDAIITKQLDSTITSWNRAAERMFGYSAAEAIGKSIRMIIPHDLQNEEETVLARIRAGLTVDHFETTRQRKDGSEVIISLTVSPIRDDSGNVVGASKIARDITERVLLRAAAQEQSLITEKLGQVGASIAASLDQKKIVQEVTDVATDLTRAECGAFFYNVVDSPSGEAYTSCTVSGTSTKGLRAGSAGTNERDLCANFPAVASYAIDDVTNDRRYTSMRFFTACRRANCRCARISPFRSRPLVEKCLVDSSSVTRRWACSRPSTSGCSGALPAGRRSRSRTRACSWSRVKRTA